MYLSIFNILNCKFNVLIWGPNELIVLVLVLKCICKFKSSVLKFKFIVFKCNPVRSVYLP